MDRMVKLEDIDLLNGYLENACGGDVFDKE
jgi:hypothetical protein